VYAIRVNGSTASWNTKTRLCDKRPILTRGQTVVIVLAAAAARWIIIFLFETLLSFLQSRDSKTPWAFVGFFPGGGAMIGSEGRKSPSRVQGQLLGGGLVDIFSKWYINISVYWGFRQHVQQKHFSTFPGEQVPPPLPMPAGAHAKHAKLIDTVARSYAVSGQLCYILIVRYLGQFLYEFHRIFTTIKFHEISHF